MFCPECRSEYRQGFKECAECHVALVESLAALPLETDHNAEIVTVYRRQTPSGNYAYMIANYVDGKRRFDSSATEGDALESADALARRIDRRADWPQLQRVRHPQLVRTASDSARRSVAEPSPR